MKKTMFLVAFAILGLVATTQAQSCCKGENAKKGKCCVKTAAPSTEDHSATAMLVSNIDEEVHYETKTFTVYGNCGMCKRTIEGALKGNKAIKAAKWDGDAQQLTVKFNPHVLTLDDIKQKIADVGYDSDTHRAKDEVYNSLPGCCQYERPTN